MDEIGCTGSCEPHASTWRGTQGFDLKSAAGCRKTKLKRFIGDFETYSEAELKKVGAYKYSLHPTTRPTCFAFKVRNEPTIYFLPYELVNLPWKRLPAEFRKVWSRLVEEGFEFTAQNAFFVRCFYSNVLVKRNSWPAIKPRRFRCTAAKAAAAGLPRNLEGAGEALKLKTQKDRRGYQAMMATCKPTATWNKHQKFLWGVFDRRKKGILPTNVHKKKNDNGGLQHPPKFPTPNRDPQVFEVLYRYCKIDVLSEEALDRALPDLIPQEQEIWFHNQMLNWRGLPIDIPTSKKILSIMDEETKIRVSELDKLTAGLVSKPGARQSILDFLELEGVKLPNLQKNTVQAKLESFELRDGTQRLLELRQALAMTSTKKYKAFIDRANPDSRVRDILLYHGAHTGRDTGTGIQPHNFSSGAHSDRPRFSLPGR